MEKQEVREVDRVYTRFRGGEIQTDSYAVQVVLHHLPEGLLRCSVSAVDQELCWNCEHTGKQSLEQYCTQSSLGHVELGWIYGGILQILKEMKAYLLDVNSLILKPEFIYLEPRDEKEWFCYVPFYVRNIWKSMQELSRFFLGHIEKQDTEAVRIAYGMYQYFNQGGQNLEEAWAILCENSGQTEQEVLPVEQDDLLKKEEAQMERKMRKGEEHHKENPPFPMLGWIIMGLSGSSAVFLLSFVALNEWYLSNGKKILFLALVVLFAAVAVFIWKKWGARMQKRNPLDDGRDDGKEPS